MLRSAWRNLVHHKLRLVLSGISIILGVGFVVGTLIFTDTLNDTFSALFGDTASDVVVTPDNPFGGRDFAGTVPTLPASLLGDVTATPGVAKAGGQVLVNGVGVIGPDGEPLGTRGAPQLGTNWQEDEELTPFRIVEGRGPSGEDEVALDSVSAEKAGLAVGDRVPLTTPVGRIDAALVGIFRYGISGNLAGATITAFSTPTAQRILLDGADAYTEIDVVADDGVTQRMLADRLIKVVGDGIQVQTGVEAADEATAQITDGLAFINVFLLVFAGIALFVGTFIILNTFSMLVAQRSRELALLRALGATRSQVMRSLVIEAAGVGAVGAVIGLAAGVGVAVALQALFGALGAEIPTNGLVILPRTIAAGVAIGIAVTVVAALAPAVRASRIPPMAALRDDPGLPARSLRTRAVAGGVLLAVGVALMVWGAGAGESGVMRVGLGALAALIGMIVVSPAIAGPVVRSVGFALPRLFGTVGSMAVQNAERQPRRTAATASALMIGLALVTALTIFASSTKASITQVIDRVIGAEFILSTEDRSPFSDEVAPAVAATAGVQSVSAVKFLPALVGGEPRGLVAVDPSSLGDMISLDFAAGSLKALDSASVVVDSDTAAQDGRSLGDSVTVQLADGTSRDLKVAGLFKPTGAWTGYVASREGIGASVGDFVIYARALPDADLTQVQDAITATVAPYAAVRVLSQAEFTAQITSSVDQILLVMIMLLSLAILIAILGIVNTLALSVTERTREIGMLRAVGALRRQIRSTVVLESLVIAIFGALVGLVLGLVFAIALQRTLVDQGIEVLDIPWSGLAAFLVLAAVVGVLAALWPAFRAGRLNVLRAIATE